MKKALAALRPPWYFVKTYMKSLKGTNMSNKPCIMVPTPIGWLRVTGDESGIAEVSFMTNPGEPPTEPGTHPPLPLLTEAAAQLSAYFQGRLLAFTLPVVPIGTSFQCRVWQETRQIPYGHTVSYKWLAERLGQPGASRAVGQALNRNPLAIIIPCHRVVSSAGRLTGYAGGLTRKQFLLEHENLCNL